MSDEEPEPEPEKPRFLLPDGCKDLIDVLRLQECGARGDGLPNSISLPEQISVGDLTAALNLEYVHILSAFMKLNVMVLSKNTQVDFSLASTICASLGVAVFKLV